MVKHLSQYRCTATQGDSGKKRLQNYWRWRSSEPKLGFVFVGSGYVRPQILELHIQPMPFIQLPLGFQKYGSHSTVGRVHGYRFPCLLPFRFFFCVSFIFTIPAQG